MVPTHQVASRNQANTFLVSPLRLKYGIKPYLQPIAFPLYFYLTATLIEQKRSIRRGQESKKVTSDK